MLTITEREKIREVGFCESCMKYFELKLGKDSLRSLGIESKDIGKLFPMTIKMLIRDSLIYTTQSSNPHNFIECDETDEEQVKRIIALYIKEAIADKCERYIISKSYNLYNNLHLDINHEIVSIKQSINIMRQHLCVYYKRELERYITAVVVKGKVDADNAVTALMHKLYKRLPVFTDEQFNDRKYVIAVVDHEFEKLLTCEGETGD